MNFQTRTAILNTFSEKVLGIPAELLRIYVQVAKPIILRVWLVGFYLFLFNSPFPIGLCGLNKTLCSTHNLTRCF